MGTVCMARGKFELSGVQFYMVAVGNCFMIGPGTVNTLLIISKLGTDLESVDHCLLFCKIERILSRVKNTRNADENIFESNKENLSQAAEDFNQGCSKFRR